MPPRPAALVPCLVLAACAAAPKAAVAPLEPLRHVPAELVLRPTERGLEPVRFEALTEEQIASSPRTLSIRVRFLDVDARAAERRLGAPSATLLSMVIAREAVGGLLADLRREGDAVPLNDSGLLLHEQQEGYVSVTDQRAYVSSFAIRSNGKEALADPQVEVVTQGAQVIATGKIEGERVTLDLRLEDCRFDPEFAERDLPLAGGHVTLQEPRGLSRSLTTRVTLARDELLIVGGASFSGRTPGRALFALVEAAPVEQD